MSPSMWRFAPMLWLALGPGCARSIPAELAVPPEEEEIVEPEDEEPIAAVATPVTTAEPPAYAAWRASHAELGDPPSRLGGPLQIALSHAGGGLYVFQPDPDNADPRAPSSDRFFTLYDARLQGTIVDRTPYDAAETEDSVRLEATWSGSDGTTYGVRCCSELGGADRDHPTFGGVLTNHLVHGASGIGSARLPTTFAWVAVWGIGEIVRNGEVLESAVPVRLMVTERTRDPDLNRLDDEEVDAAQRQLELLVEPMRRGDGGWVPSSVETGYTTSDGTLPYWHVLFPHFQMDVTEGG